MHANPANVHKHTCTHNAMCSENTCFSHDRIVFTYGISCNLMGFLLFILQIFPVFLTYESISIQSHKQACKLCVVMASMK